MSIPRILHSREARTEIPKALRRFRSEGRLADPVIFGSHRRPEAVVLPFELYTALLPAIAQLKVGSDERAGEDAPAHTDIS